MNERASLSVLYDVGPPGMYFPACYETRRSIPTFHSNTMDYIAGGSFCPATINSFQQQLRQILQVRWAEGRGNMGLN